MNPDIPHQTPEALEARLTALLLGELPPDEAAALRRALEQDPALAALHQRLKLTINLVRETAGHPAGQPAAPPVLLKLSQRRRETLLAHFKTVAPKEFAYSRREDWKKAARMGIVAAAAMLIGLLTLAVLLPSLVKSKDERLADDYRFGYSYRLGARRTISPNPTAATPTPPLAQAGVSFNRPAGQSVQESALARKAANRTEIVLSAADGASSAATQPTAALPAPAPAAAGTEVQSFPLSHADPAEMADQLAQLLPGKVAATGDSSRRSLQVTAPSDVMPHVGELVKQLDASDARHEAVRVFDLSNADPADVQAVLQDLFRRSGNVLSLSENNRNSLLGAGNPPVMPQTQKGTSISTTSQGSGGFGGIAPSGSPGREHGIGNMMGGMGGGAMGGGMMGGMGGAVASAPPAAPETAASVTDSTPFPPIIYSLVPRATGATQPIDVPIPIEGTTRDRLVEAFPEAAPLAPPAGKPAPAKGAPVAGVASTGTAAGFQMGLGYFLGAPVGGQAPTNTSTPGQQIPILGDTPTIGRLFREDIAQSAADDVEAQLQVELPLLLREEIAQSAAKGLELNNLGLSHNLAGKGIEGLTATNAVAWTDASGLFGGISNGSAGGATRLHGVDNSFGLPVSSFSSTTNIAVGEVQGLRGRVAKPAIIAGDAYFSIDRESRRVLTLTDQETDAAISQVLSNSNVRAGTITLPGRVIFATDPKTGRVVSIPDTGAVASVESRIVRAPGCRPGTQARGSRDPRAPRRPTRAAGGPVEPDCRRGEVLRRARRAAAEARRPGADPAAGGPDARQCVLDLLAQRERRLVQAGGGEPGEGRDAGAGHNPQRGIHQRLRLPRPRGAAGRASCLCLRAGALPVCAQPGPGPVLAQDGVPGPGGGPPVEPGAAAGQLGFDGAGRPREHHSRGPARAGRTTRPQDRFSLITFSRTARLRADGISGDQAARAAEEAAGLTPQGGTNLEEAMNLAYQTALRHYMATGINRVVLLTDGAANLGNVEPEALKQKVEAHRKLGVALDCFGIGWEGYNDDLLEVLTRNGDGRYGFLNTPEEAAGEFAAKLAGALRVAAADVKVQVEFNPGRVTAYRQIGYAKHQLTKEQFRDNTVAAAQLGATEAGNALYVIETNPNGDGPLGTVRVRYNVPGTSDYREQEWVVPYTGTAAPLEQAGPALRLAATSSAFAEWLASSPFAAEVDPVQTAPVPDRRAGGLRPRCPAPETRMDDPPGAKSGRQVGTWKAATA